MEKQSLEERVKETLEKIRPYLQADGGDINFVELTDDNVVKVQLTGACNGCPFSAQTLKAGVETSIKRDNPEITQVVAE